MASNDALRHPKRKEEVLRAAAYVMRPKGVMATRLQDVAEYLDVAYTALYHYFPSRDHLAEEVLLWRLEARYRLLREVKGESALARLLAFFERELVEDREYQVRFPPFSALPEENRESLVKARERLLKELVAVVDQGVEEGSIRPCHAETVANVILGMIERFVYFDQQTASRVRRMSVKQVVASMAQVLEEGILSDRSFVPRPTFVIERGEDLLAYDPALDSELERLESIFRTATRHFNVEGAGASIPRMALELGVSKTVFYQYVMDKQDLLFQCYTRGAGTVEMSHRVAADFGRDPLDEMLIHRYNLYRYHDSEAGPFTFITALHFLKPSQKRLVQLRNRAVRKISEARTQRGIDAGAIRANVDPEIVQPMFGQMLYSLPGWFSESYPLSIEEVCDQTGEVVFLGLKN